MHTSAECPPSRCSYPLHSLFARSREHSASSRVTPTCSLIRVIEWLRPEIEILLGDQRFPRKAAERPGHRIWRCAGRHKLVDGPDRSPQPPLGPKPTTETLRPLGRLGPEIPALARRHGDNLGPGGSRSPTGRAEVIRVSVDHPLRARVGEGRRQRGGPPDISVRPIRGPGRARRPVREQSVERASAAPPPGRGRGRPGRLCGRARPLTLLQGGAQDTPRTQMTRAGHKIAVNKGTKRTATETSKRPADLGKHLEAASGIEPLYRDLQSLA